MTAAFAVTLAYLATNFAFMVWLERARDRERPRIGARGGVRGCAAIRPAAGGSRRTSS